jgi:hypothetical protein
VRGYHLSTRAARYISCVDEKHDVLINWRFAFEVADISKMIEQWSGSEEALEEIKQTITRTSTGEQVTIASHFIP